MGPQQLRTGLRRAAADRAALGDRYGRRRVFLAGIAVFAVGSVLCALAASGLMLLAGRVLQGAGAAAVQPLSLTLLAGAVPPHRRSAAVGVWGGINGLGIALGPLIGGAVIQGLDWRWIFWLNVPLAAAMMVLVVAVLREQTGADRGLDLRGMLLATFAVTLAVLAIVSSLQYSWTALPVLVEGALAIALGAAFIGWERRAASPMLPLHLYRIRTFVLSNIVSLAMFFGVFGSIFFLAQFMQFIMGFTPLQAGLRTLPWTALPMLVAPLAGLVSDRVGGGRLMAAGLALQGAALGWIAVIARLDLPYPRLVPPLLVAGVGMGLALAPITAVVLGSVRPSEYGKASGANNTVREIGGALGVAVLSAVFGGYFRRYHITSPVDAARTFAGAMSLAMWVGVGVIAVRVLAALLIRPPSVDPATPDRSGQPAG